MSKFNLTNPADPPSTVISGVQLSGAKGRSGTAIIKGNVTNRTSNSPAYTAMNNQVIALDALFDTLPITGPIPGPNQQSWNAIFWPSPQGNVCGCPDSPNTGKKLFRSVNFNRILLGLSQELTPSPQDPANIWTPVEAVLQRPIDPYYPNTFLGIEDPLVAGYIFWQTAAGILSPKTYVAANSAPHGYILLPPTDGGAEAMAAIGIGGKIVACTFDTAGWPLFSNQDVAIEGQ